MYDAQVLQASITWKHCANLPTGLSEGVTTVINDKVYCGGVTDDGDDEYIVYCYDPSQDKWTTLSPLPVRFFGLGQISGELVAVGSSDTQSAWKTLPNTLTYRPAAAVLAGNLLAVGGEEISKGGDDMKEVYMYSPSTNSWIYISDLPAPRSDTTVAVLSSTEVLVIGGWDGCAVDTVYKGTLHDL